MTTRSERAAGWREHVEAHRTSGLSAKAYAEQHDLAIASLYAARQRLGVAGVRRSPTSRKAKTPPVARVVVGAPAMRVHCRAHLPGGAMLEMECDTGALPAVLAALQGAPS